MLDDNKKLCLASGEILPFPPHLSLLLETPSLAQASPATVSRLSVVHCDPAALETQAVVAPTLANPTSGR